MKKTFIAIVTIVFTLGAFNVEAQKLSAFGAEMGKKQVGPKTIRVPYMDVTSYFGYMDQVPRPMKKRIIKSIIICMFGFRLQLLSLV